MQEPSGSSSNYDLKLSEREDRRNRNGSEESSTTSNTSSSKQNSNPLGVQIFGAPGRFSEEPDNISSFDERLDRGDSSENSIRSAPANFGRGGGESDSSASDDDECDDENLCVEDGVFAGIEVGFSFAGFGETTLNSPDVLWL